jgi:serine/threonine protein kinase
MYLLIFLVPICDCCCCSRIVYRDIKQENIGFDIRGDVKVFDFGLSKSLSQELKKKDLAGREEYGYQLTPRTGSVPYMAPEVAECKPYDTKCDVFSFSILLWEILSMKPAFKGYSRREFLVRVARGGERLPISRKWPPLTRLAVRESWEPDPLKRPDMKRVAALLRGDLNELTSDPNVRDRTTHMRDRSTHSSRISRAVRLTPGGIRRGSVTRRDSATRVP